MFNLMALPYSPNSFSDLISSEAFSFHYGKHHQAYVDNLNKLIAGSEMENLALVDIIKMSFLSDDLKAVFNNSAQIFNHDFYWQSLSPEKKEMSEKLKEMIERDFSSFDNFKDELKKSALAQFGSGWTWLVVSEGGLSITNTSNADTPIVLGKTPLLCLDVWEHAYYIDYRNRRVDYLEALINNCLNWEFASSNLDKYLSLR